MRQRHSPLLVTERVQGFLGDNLSVSEFEQRQRRRVPTEHRSVRTHGRLRAVIAESFECIHRRNLVGMDILPMCLLPTP